MNVSQIIGKWFDSNKRFLPWRETRNPYNIWISEIILQQTRVNQGFAYYQRFIEKYPELTSLASASIEDVLLLWQGLGYYSRARNMHKTAQLLVERNHATFPEDYDQLLSLPGIGEYTAGAIASLAFNIPVISIDGNVRRVLSRYFGISTDTGTASGKDDFIRAAEELLDRKNPGKHNQAMIELGALICQPFNPKCNECPINENCYAYKTNQVNRFPVKGKKTKSRNRFFYYLVFRKKNKIIIRQRDTHDIWALLFDFPLIELKRSAEMDTLMRSDDWRTLTGSSNFNVLSVSKQYKHILSHQVIYARFIEIQPDDAFHIPSTLEVDKAFISQYPLPRLIDIYLNDSI